MEPSPSPGLLLLVETLRSQGSGSITVRGASMNPTLRDGWRLQVQAMPGSDLQVGEIGVFLHGGSLTIHRLVWRNRLDGKESLVFQGDNNAVRETVPPEAVLGRVQTAEARREDGTFSSRFAVGSDSRATFYRLVHRSHGYLSRYFPGLRIPPPGAPQATPYRLLRAVFRSLEGIISPRPRR